jgi:hypothetical protein
MLSHTVGQTVRLSEKSVRKVETYPDTRKDERHPEPDFAGDGQLPFRLQVIAEGDTEEHDTQCHEHDSN